MIRFSSFAVRKKRSLMTEGLSLVERGLQGSLTKTLCQNILRHLKVSKQRGMHSMLRRRKFLIKLEFLNLNRINLEKILLATVALRKKYVILLKT